MIRLVINLPFLVPFSCLTNCIHFAHTLKQKFGCYVNDSTTPTYNTIMVTCEYSADKNDWTPGLNCYSLSYCEHHIYTSSPLQVLSEIIYQYNNFSPAIFPLHGAAVEYDKHAYLFIAATSSGKTTLASYLTSNGFGYITDDCILIDRETFNIYPCTTPLHLRPGGISVLKEYDISPDSIVPLRDPSFYRFVYTPTNYVSKSLPIGKVFFITITQNDNHIEKMNTTERMTCLLKSSLTEYPMDRYYLQFIARLSNIPCYKLYYNDMRYVAEVLQNESTK